MSRTSPGAMGALTTLPPLPMVICTPLPFPGSCGQRWPPMEEKPIFPGSARVRKISCRVVSSQTAREARNPACGDNHIHKRDIHRFSLFRMCSTGACLVIFQGKKPQALTAAAMPAMVPSTIKGKTLLVPVDMGRRGVSPHFLATARLVPSPPRVTMHPAPISWRSSAARVLSRGCLPWGFSKTLHSAKRPGLPVPWVRFGKDPGMKNTSFTPMESRPKAHAGRYSPFHDYQKQNQKPPCDEYLFQRMDLL